MVKDAIKSLIERSETNLTSKRIKDRLKIYVLGLEDRLNQVDYCLSVLKTLSGSSTETTSTTASITIDINKRAEFYCDTFWTWVYSSLDILAQIINQAENLKLDEERVSFDIILKHIKDKHLNPRALPVLESIKKSNLYAWIKGYRNCANHRRPICLWHERKTVTQTKSYETSSGPIERVVRYICDHKVTLKPKEKMRKDLLQRCEKANLRLTDYVEKTLNKLL